MELRPGSRWRSAVCETEVIVVRAPGTPVQLACGGVEMVPHGADAPAGASLDPAQSDGTLLGKRYADEGAALELLCTKPGTGSLTVDGARVALKEAKALPSSD